MKKNFFYNFLLTGSNLLFPLVTFPYLSRILGAEGLGVYNFLISYIRNYIIIAALGIPIYGIREIAKAGDDILKRSKLFFEILTIHLLFSFFLIAIYSITIFINIELLQYKKLALIGGGLILLNVFSIEWFFAGINEFKFITIRSLIIKIVSLILIFIFVREKKDYSLYLYIYIATVFLTSLADIYTARKFITRKIIFTARGVLSHIKPMFILGVYMVLTSVYTVLPATLLGFFSTKASVGYYYGADRVIRLVISVFSALIIVMIPKLNLAVEKRKTEEYISLIDKGIKVIIIFGIPIAFFVFLLARPIMLLLGGEDFIRSISVIKIMAPIILIVSFAQIFVYLILSANRQDKQMVVLSITGMILSLSINLIFIPYYSEKATGLSQVVSELVVTSLAFYFCKRVINFSFPLKTLFVNAIFVFPFALLTYWSNQLFSNNFLILIFSGALCGLYFMIYQMFFIKDILFISLVKPHLGFLLIKEKSLL